MRNGRNGTIVLRTKPDRPCRELPPGNFDIDRYVASVAALDDSDIDYDDSVAIAPDDALRCLRYMHASSTTPCATCVTCS